MSRGEEPTQYICCVLCTRVLGSTTVSMQYSTEQYCMAQCSAVSQLRLATVSQTSKSMMQCRA
eukprot:9504015-Pyramimonas_sp.AAC.1